MNNNISLDELSTLSNGSTYIPFLDNLMKMQHFLCNIDNRKNKFSMILENNKRL